MNSGVTYVEVNYDTAWVNNSLAGLQSWSWLYEWGMYLFLLAAVAILFWIFYDSITKKKDQKALVPRILAMIGLFAIVPAFIFRFTGTANGVTTLVRLNAEAGAPYYPGPINWNVNWLVAGYGPTIAMVTLVGVLLSIVAVVIYASSVQRAKPSTEFVRKIDDIERKVDKVAQNATSSTIASSATSARVSTPATAGTVIDRKPQAATVIDIPKSGDTLTVSAGNSRGIVHDLPSGKVTIGRDSACTIVLDDVKVSGKHVELTYGQQGWTALDCGSTNGTYVNGQRLSGQQRLNNGDTIKIGDTSLVLGTTR